MKIVLIRIISTIVVSIAKPIRFHTNGRIFTLHMTLRAGYILISTSYFRFIRGTVVLTIVDTITFLTFRDTSVIFASEFTGSTIFVFAIQFVSTITTIVFVVTSPCIENTSSVCTSKRNKKKVVKSQSAGVI